MSDEEWKRKIKGIVNPYELLREVSSHFRETPVDPYYSDLTGALLDRCDELVAASDKRVGPGTS